MKKISLVIYMFLFFSASETLTAQFIYNSNNSTSYYDEASSSSTILLQPPVYMRGLYIDEDKGEITTASDFLKLMTYDLDGRFLRESDIYPVGSSTRLTLYLNGDGSFVSNSGGISVSPGPSDPFGNNQEIISGNVVDFVIDSLAGKLYWADGTSNKIFGSSLDGNDIQELYYLPSGLADVRSIRLDRATNKLYWTNFGQNRIQRINTDGSEFENLITNIDEPLALQIVGADLYWSSKNNILRYNMVSTLIDSVATDLPAVPQHFAHIPAANELYWVSTEPTGLIQKVNTESLSITPILASGDDLDYDNALAYDPLGQKIYVSSGYEQGILTSSVDGANSDWIGNQGFFEVTDIAVDPVQETMFTSHYGGIFYKSLHDDSTHVVLEPLPGAFLETPETMQLDVTNQKIYFNTRNQILQINYDGSGLDTLLSTTSSYINSFALDPTGEVLYYSFDGFVRRLNLVSTVDEPIILGNANRILVDVASGSLYYVKSSSLYKSDLDGYFEEQLEGINLIDHIISEDISSFIVLNTVNGLAVPSGDNIELSWGIDETFIASTNGDDTGDFLIQKRDSDNQWTEIGSVPYIPNTSTYMFIDQDPETGLNQYRLQYKSEDEGLVAFSTTFDVDFISTAVENVAAATSLIYSMQTGDLIATNAIGSLRIMDMSGRLVLNRKIVSEQIQIPLSHYGPGVYVVSLKSKDGSLFTQKITVI